MNWKACLWMWGQDVGTHHQALNNAWKLPGENKMEPAEGARALGIPNMCRIAMGNKPVPPFDNEMEKLKDFPKVAWSIIGDESSDRTGQGNSDLEEVLRLAKKYPNITGGVMDDFFAPARINVYTPEIIRGFADRLHEANLNLWTVLYEHQLELDIKAQLQECDIVSFWTWKAENLWQLEENLEKVEALITDKQEIYAGCYFWDYGGKQPIPEDLMVHQLTTYQKWLQSGRIKGIIFCSNCIQDIGLETVEMTKEWIENL